SALSGTFATPVAAYAFLVFVLLYIPCVAAVSTIRKEMNSTKWTLRSIAWQLGSAYLGAFVVYQVGSLLFR
ncbi:MAG: nucleoside recognition domain-containing protein, partial [Pseudoflavonifractor sp.]